MSSKFRYRNHPLLYEINTADWLFGISNYMGKPVCLADVPSEEWDKFKNMGMDFIWLMGVWTRSEKSRKLCLNSSEIRTRLKEVLPEYSTEDVLGSCFSISSYMPDPLVGRWADLDHARAELNKRGIGLILDFVPNHTGMDHHWLSEHPEYYIQGNETDFKNDNEAFFNIKVGRSTLHIAHGRDPNFPPWTDTAQLNYFNPSTRSAMIETIKELAQHCDGLRCDMAMLVLNDVFNKVWGWANRNNQYQMPQQEFWSQVISAAPNLVYLAEAYWNTEWTLQQLGFDFVYDKRFYDKLRQNLPREVFLHLKTDLTYQNKTIRFIENHDEERSLVVFGKEMLPANAVLFAGLPGLKLFFQGQMDGRQIRLPVQIRRGKVEKADPYISNFYSSLLTFIDDDIYHSGTWRLKEVYKHIEESNNNLIAYLWKSGLEIRLTIVNLARKTSSGRICFQDDVDEEIDYRLEEVFSGLSSINNGKIMAHPGLIFELAGGQAQIYKINPAT